MIFGYEIRNIVSVVFAAVILILFGTLFKDGLALFDYTISSDGVYEDTEVGVIDHTKNQVKGADVISYIRYYKDKAAVTVVVNNGASTKSYTTQDYDSGIFTIAYKDDYTVNWEYGTDQVIDEIKCVKN